METRTILLYSTLAISVISIFAAITLSDVSYILYGAIIMVLIYVVLTYIVNINPDILDTLTKLTPLSANKVLLMPDKTQSMLLGNSGSTVIGFFNIQQGDRTATYVDKLQTDKFIPLIQVANNWYVEILHAPRGHKNISARLRVQTKDSSGILKDEIMELPPLPNQKWVCIAVLRDGRRFDVIYDDKIVASQRLQNYPVVISSPLSIGNKGLEGSVIHVIVCGRRYSPHEVERERLKYIDTNNMVLESNLFDVSFPNLSLFGQCPSGLPCDPVMKPPRDNLFQWSTPYA
jgi:hypothetical protein